MSKDQLNNTDMPRPGYHITFRVEVAIGRKFGKAFMDRGRDELRDALRCVKVNNVVWEADSSLTHCTYK